MDVCVSCQQWAEWQCTSESCSHFFCHPCRLSTNHWHDMVPIVAMHADPARPSDDPEISDRHVDMILRIDRIKHAVRCVNSACRYDWCYDEQYDVKHFRLCMRRMSGQCWDCEKMKELITYKSTYLPQMTFSLSDELSPLPISMGERESIHRLSRIPESYSPIVVREMTNTLTHAANCTDPRCDRNFCDRMKEHGLHFKRCSRRLASCVLCAKILELVFPHSRTCELLICNVPYCMNIRAEVGHRFMEDRFRQLAVGQPDNAAPNPHVKPWIIP
ncbi:unnamed protein product [Caenorhabditis sp. 36 PRJEB53466]|nr:unnamed protein product [Caenorhabditis sp. 36 PRJEB53466]